MFLKIGVAESRAFTVGKEDSIKHDGVALGPEESGLRRFRGMNVARVRKWANHGFALVKRRPTAESAIKRSRSVYGFVTKAILSSPSNSERSSLESAPVANTTGRDG